MRVSLLQFDGATTLRCLPLAAGLLAATVKADPDIGPEVVLELETRRRDIASTIDALDRPDVLALSAHAWNIRYALAVTRGAKERCPAARVVMGGPSVPRRRDAASAFLRQQGSIDVLAFGEGEITFRELLRTMHRGQPLAGVEGIAFRERSNVVFTAPHARMKNLGLSVSPLLAVDSVPRLDPTRRREPADVLAVVALSDLDRFYAEVGAVTKSLLGPSTELEEVFRFQRLLTPAPGERDEREARFERDWAAFAAHPGPRPPPLDHRATTLRRSAPAWPMDDGVFYESYLAMAYSKSGRPGVRSEPGVADPHALTRA